jgi:hypothetical protein
MTARTTFFTDGVHPAPEARAIFVQEYWDHLKADPVAQPLAAEVMS